jgi:hypothetical protein
MTHVEFVEQLKRELPATSRQGDWARDYGERKTVKRDWSEYVMWVSAIGIIAVCSVLIYTEYLQ